MTPKEAIETIKVVIAEVEWNYPLIYSVVFETAIEALENQIPKKPIEDTVNLTDFKTFHCPICKWMVGRPQKYCDDCGQALDWSDNE